MKNRILSIPLVVLLMAGVLSGCAAKNATVNGTERMPADAVVGDEPRETLNTEQMFLTNNRSISGGPKSALLSAEGTGFIPTGRLSGPDHYVRWTQSMVPNNLAAGGIVLTNVYDYNEAGQQISSATQAGKVYESFAYDEQGRLIRHVNEDDLYAYNYDGDGQLQSIDHYDAEYYPEGGWKGHIVYVYEGGTVTESYYRGESEIPEYYTVYVEENIQEYRYQGRYTQEWEFYEYDEYGNLKYMLSADEGEKEILFEYHYNEYGVLSQVTCYSDGEPDGSNWLYHYNDAGDCVRIELGDVDRDTDAWNIRAYFEFTYDADGNLLTEHAYYADGEPLNSYYMEYTYQPRP